MDVTPLVASDRKIIQSYGPGLFRVSGESYEQTGIIVFPDRVEVWDLKGNVEDLTEADLSMLMEAADEIDVALLGCGATMQFVSPAFRKGLSGKGLSIEPMDTGAACRTYNVLLAEGRRVAAALIPV